MKKAKLVFTLASLTHFCFAQVEFRNLKEVIAYADEHNISLQKAEINKQAVATNAAISRAGLLPKINAFSTAGYDPIIPSQVIPDKVFGGMDGKFTKVQFGMPYNFSAGMEATVPILNFEKWAALRTSRLQNEKSKWTSEATKEVLHEQVIEIYCKALAFQHLILVNNQNEQVAKQLLGVMTKRNEQGVANPSDVNRTKNLVIDIQSASVEFEKNLSLSLNALKSLLNLAGDINIILKDSLSLQWQVPQLKDLGMKALNRESESSYQVALQQLEESKKASLPKLSLQSRYYNQWLMTNGANAQTVHFDAATFGLRMDVSLFNGGYNRAMQKKALLNLEVAGLDKQQVQLNLERQQTDWLTSFLQAQKRWSLVQQKLIATSDNIRIAQLNMKEGLMEFEEFNNIFNEHIKAAIEKIQTQLDGILYKTLLTQ